MLIKQQKRIIDCSSLNNFSNFNKNQCIFHSYGEDGNSFVLYYCFNSLLFVDKETEGEKNQMNGLGVFFYECTDRGPFKIFLRAPRSLGLAPFSTSTNDMS